MGGISRHPVHRAAATGAVAMTRQPRGQMAGGSDRPFQVLTIPEGPDHASKRLQQQETTNAKTASALFHSFT